MTVYERNDDFIFGQLYESDFKIMDVNINKTLLRHEDENIEVVADYITDRSFIDKHDIYGFNILNIKFKEHSSDVKQVDFVILFSEDSTKKFHNFYKKFNIKDEMLSEVLFKNSDLSDISDMDKILGVLDMLTDKVADLSRCNSIIMKKIYKFNKMDTINNKFNNVHQLIIDDETDDESEEDIAPLDFKPSDVKKYLDRHVVGQEEAKKVLSVALYNHYKRIINNKSNAKTKINKSNILMIGPSGVGKTELTRHISKYLKLPFVSVDATSFTDAGYVGDNVEDIIYRLYVASDRNIENTENGVVFIDEIDKLRKNGKEVGSIGVQQALLKIIEGCDVNIKTKNAMMETPEIKINTSNILFICAGAFDGLVKGDDVNTSRKIGFGSDLTYKVDNNGPKSLSDVKADDLIKYGMSPELMGRLPILVKLNSLSEDELMRILIEPEESIIKQYKQLFNPVKLEFTDDALKAVINKVNNNKTGARELRTVLEHVMNDVMFNTPDMENVSKCIITDKVINDGANPRYTYKRKKS